jgi:AcrR family transcriptional regulator
MTVLSRAVQAEDKELRRTALLDAAEALILEQPRRLPSVDEVAAGAGVSKGTVYLYFAAKEDILLALHERHKDAFFVALIARVEQAAPMTIDEMVALTHRYITGVPAFLPLAAVTFAAIESGVSPEAIRSFHARMGEQLGRAGAGIERHFGLPPGEGVRLLSHSYGLIVGLWRLAAAERPADVPAAACPMTRATYPAELEQGLRDLWAGRIARVAQPDAYR